MIDVRENRSTVKCSSMPMIGKDDVSSTVILSTKHDLKLKLIVDNKKSVHTKLDWL